MLKDDAALIGEEIPAFIDFKNAAVSLIFSAAGKQFFIYDSHKNSGTLYHVPFRPFLAGNSKTEMIIKGRLNDKPKHTHRG